MCLILKFYYNFYKPKVAKEDIVCYKWCEKWNTSNGEIILTPYREVKVEIGETYKSNLIKVNGIQPVVNIGIHSFARKRAAKKDYINYGDGDIIIKCIIPAGSTYYTGMFLGKKSYASDTLKYVEICA